jgi:hypothetical protein
VQRWHERGKARIEGDKMILEYPIQFHSKDGFQSISGSIDFGLYLQLVSDVNETS